MRLQNVNRTEYAHVGLILDELGLRCMHCRIIFMTHTDHASVQCELERQRQLDLLRPARAAATPIPE